MSDFQVHYDFPAPDSVVASGDDTTELCPGYANGYGCTRESGHAGDHQACGLGDRVLASWPQGYAAVEQ